MNAIDPKRTTNSAAPFPLTALARELRRRRMLDPPPSYRVLYNAVLDGRIPAHQTPNGRWFWRFQDLAAIADTFRRPPDEPGE